MKFSQIFFSILLAAPHATAFVPPSSALHKRGQHASIAIVSTEVYSSTSSETKELQSLSYAGAGKPTVDMNQYNLPLSEVANELTAVVQAASSMQDEGIFLAARSTKDVFVDTLQYKVKRDGGLGLILTELAGGREDGIGITIVEELVEGGNAVESGILPGDSIVALTLLNTSTSGMSVEQERLDVATECLGYDATVEKLMALPPPATDNEEIILTVKRLRRKPKVTVKLQYPPYENEPDTVLELFAGENLRRAMLTRGVKLNDVLSKRFDSGGTGDCGADGTCATCAVGVVRGEELLSPKKQQEEQIFSRAGENRWRMACKTTVGYGMASGDITLQVNPKQWDR